MLRQPAQAALGLGKAQYTAPFVEKYRIAVRRRLEAGGFDSAEELEKACWAGITLGSPADAAPPASSKRKRDASASETAESRGPESKAKAKRKR